ncbi:amino acid ABC transporter permease [Malaciobacter mytili]|uniref:ABC transporter permease n=1 Tax=Malaciobacter mytili LMG 24559 TaxID=1032238 RepID=A0AAX2AEL3_9BACT|nr:amino acid ABC transporter permease [Malaciobacter mytili]AXH14014.1 amino acid ABC transporter, permease protein [Malaciobacter mytili LMG 24559]RXI43387.1 ABC transporter permease [Malaciobacter mytili]RXK15080.1 ABC transporter permease [Malaciobacter mytili LMG 24559]
MTSFDIDYTLGIFPILFKYIDITISMALIATAIALVIAIIIAIIKTFKIKFLSSFCDLYISFLRGTPLIVQLFLLYFGLPQILPIFSNLDAYSASIAGLSLHFSAYMAESIRGAISSIDKGQFEAASSLGMSKTQSFSHIILPQAIRVAIPSLMNNFIDLIKSTSLAFTLGVPEIMAKAQLEASSSYKYFEAFLAVALVYWVIVITFTYLQKRIEKRLNKAYSI